MVRTSFFQEVNMGSIPLLDIFFKEKLNKDLVFL